MNPPQDFKEFIELMIAANVRFVMIGGYAYNLYRNPRATGDIDFIVSRDALNQQRLRSVLVDFGFGESLPPTSQDLVDEDRVLMLGRSPFRIDLMSKIEGVTFEEVERTCQQVLIDELQIPVISPATLLKNKRATGRTKDLADAEELEKWLFPDGDDIR
jgi:hypothetical protein